MLTLRLPGRAVFDPPKPKVPEPPPPPPQPDDEEVKQAADAEKDRDKALKSRRARQSTIATSPLGVEGDAPVQRKTLLGG